MSCHTAGYRVLFVPVARVSRWTSEARRHRPSRRFGPSPLRGRCKKIIIPDSISKSSIETSRIDARGRCFELRPARREQSIAEMSIAMNLDGGEQIFTIKSTISNSFQVCFNVHIFSLPFPVVSCRPVRLSGHEKKWAGAFLQRQRAGTHFEAVRRGAGHPDGQVQHDQRLQAEGGGVAEDRW